METYLPVILHLCVVKLNISVKRQESEYNALALIYFHLNREMISEIISAFCNEILARQK